MTMLPSRDALRAEAGEAIGRILIVGINYAPEPVGIGPYTADMAAGLAARGHAVEVIAARPYYPAWRIAEGFAGPGYASAWEEGVRVTRCPLYVPAWPSGGRRILHHLSFALSILPPLVAACLRRRPGLVMVVAPSMLCAPLVRLCARMAGARLWLHIQDFEVGAAFATGLIAADSLRGRLASRFERIAYGGFDRYSSISPQMCRRLVAMGMPAGQVAEIRNWASLDAIRPMASADSPYRREWGIATLHVALYSGNIAYKQGIGILLEAARRLRDRPDLTFLICGEGPHKAQLMAEAADLPNIRFHDLQPRERLGELLGLATVHLLPQIAGAADLVLPSKLTNMLASGKPVVATADPGTGLFEEMAGCGRTVPPGDADAFAAGIAALLDDKAAYAGAAAVARSRAAERWSENAILNKLNGIVLEMMTAGAMAPQ